MRAASGGETETSQPGVDTAAEDIEDVLHACLAVGGQAPQIRPSDKYGAGAESERLDDVGAAADAAVQDDLYVVADSLAIGAACGSQPGCAVEVVATMVGHRQRVTPASTARLASSTRQTPLSKNGPSQVFRIHSTSAQVGGGVVIHS